MGKSFQWPRTREDFDHRSDDGFQSSLVADNVRSLAMVACEQLPPPPPVAVPRQERPRVPESFPDSSWLVLDEVSLTDVFQQRFAVLQSCPHHVRGRFLQTLQSGRMIRSWKSGHGNFVWLLRRSPGDARVSKEDLCRRFDLFAEGHWDTLCDEAVAAITTPAPQREPRTDNRRASNGGLPESAVGRSVPSSTVSHWCRSSTGNVDTLRELQSKRPQEVLRPLPQHIREFHPESPLELDRDKFLQSLKTAPRGSSPGPGGFTYEHLKIMMDEEDTLELFLYDAATGTGESPKFHRICIDACTVDRAF